MSENPAALAEKPIEILDPSACGPMVEEAMAAGIHIPDPERVIANMSSLVERYGIAETYFEDTPAKLVFMSLASELAVGEQEGNQEDHVFTHTVMKHLLGNHATKLEDQPHEDSISWEGRIENYESLTNAQLTAELDEFMTTNPAVAELRQRLGLAADHRFNARVLNIKGTDPVPRGLLPKDQDYDTPQFGNSSEKAQDTAAVMAHVARLEKNNHVLQSLNDIAALRPAWADVNTSYLESSLVLLPAPQVEAIQRGIATEHSAAGLLHELTHSEESLLIPGAHSIFGLALEELRAEHFSGNKNGYGDIKAVGTMMEIFGASGISEFFEPDGQPFDRDRFVTDIARQYGLDGLARLYTMVPVQYLKEQNPSYESIFASLNNHFSSLGHVAEFFKQRGESHLSPEQIQANIEAWIEQERSSANAAKPNYVLDRLWYKQTPLILFKAALAHMKAHHPEELGKFDWQAKIDEVETGKP